MLQEGKYQPVLAEREKDRLFFVGDVKNPLIIGKKADIMAMVDEEFYEIYNMYRWVKCGMLKLDINTDPYCFCVGVRILMEANQNA